MKNFLLKLTFVLVLISLPLLSFSDELKNKDCPSIFSQLQSLNKYWNDFEVDEPLLLERKCFNSHEDLIQTHLKLVVNHLRENAKQGLSKQQLDNRSDMLNILEDYWQEKIFPKNTKHPGQTIPYFVDEFNTACAVGHVMRESGALDIVAKISKETNFAFIENMNYPELRLWAKAYGFTLEELKWIQPAYCDLNGTIDFNDYPLGQFSSNSICFRGLDGGGTPDVAEEFLNKYLSFGPKDRLAFSLTSTFYNYTHWALGIRVKESKKASIDFLHAPSLSALKIVFQGDNMGIIYRGHQHVNFTYTSNRFFTLAVETEKTEDEIRIYIDDSLIYEGEFSETYDFSQGSSPFISELKIESPDNDYVFDIDDITHIYLQNNFCQGDEFLSAPIFESIISTDCQDCQQLTEYTWKDGTHYYLHELTCDISDWDFTTIYSCHGEKIIDCQTTIGGEVCKGFNLEKFKEELNYSRLIWECGNENSFCDFICETISCDDMSFNGQINGSIPDDDCYPAVSFENYACGQSFEGGEVLYHLTDVGYQYISFESESDLQLSIIEACEEDASCIAYLLPGEGRVFEIPSAGAYLIVDSKSDIPSATYEVNLFDVEFRQDTICSGDTLMFFDQELVSVGKYFHILENSVGCKTYVELELISGGTNIWLENSILCIGDTIEVEGVSLYYEGIDEYDYRFIEYLNDQGCLSYIVGELSWVSEFVMAESIYLCEGDFYEWRGNDYTETGNYEEVVLNSGTCDSVFQLIIELKSPTSEVVDTNAIVGTYFAGELINADTTFTKIYVNEFGCEHTVTYYVSIVTSSEEIGQGRTINIFPNPISNKALNIKLENSAALEISIFTMLGQEVYRNNFKTKTDVFQVDLDALTGGTYLMQLVLEGEIYVEKIIIP